MAFMDTPDFRTHKERWVLHAGFEAGLQSDSDAGVMVRRRSPGSALALSVSNHEAASSFEMRRGRSLGMRLQLKG
jgi:hypothetical protein